MDDDYVMARAVFYDWLCDFLPQHSFANISKLPTVQGMVGITEFIRLHPKNPASLYVEGRVHLHHGMYLQETLIVGLKTSYIPAHLMVEGTIEKAQTFKMEGLTSSNVDQLSETVNGWLRHFWRVASNPKKCSYCGCLKILSYSGYHYCPNHCHYEHNKQVWGERG